MTNIAQHAFTTRNKVTVLSDGSKKARLLAQEKISEIREVIGIKKIS